jgi:hypothetical protein
MCEKKKYILFSWSFESLAQSRKYPSALKLVLNHHFHSFVYGSSSHAKLFHNCNNMGEVELGLVLPKGQNKGLKSGTSYN